MSGTNGKNGGEPSFRVIQGEGNDKGEGGPSDDLSKSALKIEQGGVLFEIDQSDFSSAEIKEKVKFVFKKVIFCFDEIKKLLESKERIPYTDRVIKTSRIEKNVMASLEEVKNGFSEGRINIVINDVSNIIIEKLRILSQNFIDDDKNLIESEKKEIQTEIFWKIVSIVTAYFDSNGVNATEYVDFFNDINKQIQNNN